MPSSSSATWRRHTFDAGSAARRQRALPRSEVCVGLQKLYVALRLKKLRMASEAPGQRSAGYGDGCGVVALLGSQATKNPVA
jgi:hypothetical protein